MISSNEVTSATNKISELLSQAEVEHDRSLALQAQALTHSCDFLRRLNADGDFIRQYEATTRSGDASAVQQTGLSAIGAVSESSKHFIGFLRREQDLLTKSGMEQSVAAWLVSRVQKNIEGIERGAPSGKMLSSSLKTLEEATCSQSERILGRLSQVRRRSILVSSFGGVALITVNIAAAATILSQVGAGASASIGGGLVVLAVQELRRA